MTDVFGRVKTFGWLKTQLKQLDFSNSVYAKDLCCLPSRVLDGLTPEQAVTKLEGWPYSVAEVVAHMLFWQKHDLATIEIGAEPEASDEASWPPVTKDDWPRLEDEFLANLEKSREIARDPKNLDHLIVDGKFTVGLRMVWFTSHNAHHLGQVVLMRRIIGVWPL